MIGHRYFHVALHINIFLFGFFLRFFLVHRKSTTVRAELFFVAALSEEKNVGPLAEDYISPLIRGREFGVQTPASAIERRRRATSVKNFVVPAPLLFEAVSVRRKMQEKEALF